MRAALVPSQIRISTIKVVSLPDLAPGLQPDKDTRELIELLAVGGDARIVLDPETGLNRYLSGPYPRRTLAYASSTANDLSRAAFDHLLSAARRGGQGSYADRLDHLRRRLRSAYRLPEDVAVVFAPSGTDLEYVALASARGKANGGIHNILLGADEVGSGCIHSAHGQYFARETALGISTKPGRTITGLGPVSLADIPVRCANGLPQSSAKIAAAIRQEIEVARMDGRHALVHVVHGSKTGLILPELGELDELQREYAEVADFVVDACQARIDSATLNVYLERGIMVFLSGSKFMGGPPFNGFALVPCASVRKAAPIPSGFADIFRSDEWPAEWAGRESLPDGDNPGLALRFEASVFELERFQALPAARVQEVIDSFVWALGSELVEPLGLSLVQTHADAATARENPIEMRTLATLDLGGLARLNSFEDARILHHRLALKGVRLGQPVHSVRRAGEWGPTIRVCLSMPQFSDLEVGGLLLQERLAEDMRIIASGLAAI